MYNLLVSGRGWGASQDVMFTDRLFEYTETRLVQRFSDGTEANLEKLIRLPALFVDETRGSGDAQAVRVGTITRARHGVREVLLEYAFDSDVPPLTNAILETMARELDIDNFEFSRMHWAVKDVDLYRVLLRKLQPRKPRPRVFSIQDPESIEPSLISAMMPFHPHFDGVYEALKAVSTQAGFRCRRADDIWENPSIIQDVVSLIDRSQLVVADCTGRNPNVFYEIGIAH